MSYIDYFGLAVGMVWVQASKHIGRDLTDLTPAEIKAEQEWAEIEQEADRLEKLYQRSPEDLVAALDREQRAAFIDTYAREVAERVAKENYHDGE